MHNKTKMVKNKYNKNETKETEKKKMILGGF